MVVEPGLRKDLEWAADFDSAGPRLGLGWSVLGSNSITRREMFRLMIAAGATY